MVAYSFKRQFVEPILSGAKCQTIRADRRRHARPGEQLQLYTGMRTKHCKLIARATCEAIEPVMLDFSGYGVVKVGGNVLFSDARMQAFARQDGFSSWAEMRAFWCENHPRDEIFEGVLIRWGSIDV
jgi:hypothetical protein